MKGVQTHAKTCGVTRVTAVTGVTAPKKRTYALLASIVVKPIPFAIPLRLLHPEESVLLRERQHHMAALGHLLRRLVVEHGGDTLQCAPFLQRSHQGVLLVVVDQLKLVIEREMETGDMLRIGKADVGQVETEYLAYLLAVAIAIGGAGLKRIVLLPPFGREVTIQTVGLMVDLIGGCAIVVVELVHLLPHLLLPFGTVEPAVDVGEGAGGVVDFSFYALQLLYTILQAPLVGVGIRQLLQDVVEVYRGGRPPASAVPAPDVEDGLSAA